MSVTDGVDDAPPPRTTFLDQLHEVHSTPGRTPFVVGTTYAPWKLDDGFLGHFGLYVYVPPLSREPWLKLLRSAEKELKDDIAGGDLDPVNGPCENFSSSDLLKLVDKAIMIEDLQRIECGQWYSNAPCTTKVSHSLCTQIRSFLEHLCIQELDVHYDLKEALAMTPGLADDEELEQHIRWAHARRTFS